MVSYVFYLWWAISFLVLLIFASLIGKLIGRGLLGILIDDRERYSLTHFQVVLWTIVILSSLLGVFISSSFDASKIIITSDLLGLMGIVAGSGVLATAVKATKDASPTSTVARHGFRVTGYNDNDGQAQKEPITQRFAQIWLLEESAMADKVVDITKYQNFIFTLVILMFYIAQACKVGGLPVLPSEIVWLIGISHAGYVGGKIPNKV